MKKYLDDYTKLCNLISSPDDTPGFGGNVSVRAESVLIIKPSGTRVRDCETSLLSIRATTPETLEMKRASMEYRMHQMINYKYVVHYHPLYAMPVLCSDNELAGLDYATVNYAQPGDDLAEVLINHVDDKIIFLKNHGIILSSNNINEIIDNYNLIKAECFASITMPILSPDDAVIADKEQLTHNLASLGMAALMGITMNTLSSDDIDKLNNNEAEAFRKSKL